MGLANWGLSWVSFGFLSGQRSLGGEEPRQWSVQLNWSSWYFKSRKEFWKNWKMSQAWGRWNEIPWRRVWLGPEAWATVHTQVIPSFLVFFYFAALEMEPRALHLLGSYARQLHPNLSLGLS